MKRKCSKKSKIMSIMIAIALVASVFTSVPTVKASDASDVASVDKKVTLELQSQPRNKTGQISISGYGLYDGAKVTNLKSSNKKVLTVSWSKKYPSTIVVKLKKTGKAVVSFDVVYNGQKTSLSTKVTVKKYVNPCAVFKVGNKNYTSKFKRDADFYTSHKGTPKRKVYIKAAKNWKIESIYYYNYPDYKVKPIKSKSNVRFSAKKGGYAYIQVQFKNKKTKEIKTVFYGSKRKK